MYNHIGKYAMFHPIYTKTWNLMVKNGARVKAGTWQGVDVSSKPDMDTFELMNYGFTLNLCGDGDLDNWRTQIKPNAPWADDHFEERVCGYPINPGTEWRNWPWGHSADTFRDENGKFNHNYMERYWPKHANVTRATLNVQDAINAIMEYEGGRPRPLQGIRNEYGDMDDLVKSLAANPYSRQEWFPIFHPEDVGEVIGGRKPCTLGYQFIVRNGRLHVFYPMRSCDFYRHFRDDIYLTLRLLLWVINRCRDISPIPWEEITPGSITFHATSLHVFANDWYKMKDIGPKS